MNLFQLRRCSRIATLLFVASAATACFAQYSSDVEFARETQAQVLAATVRVTTPSGTGTAFIIHQDATHGYCFTAAHCADNSPQWIQLERFSLESWPDVVAVYSAEVFSINEVSDLAILRFNADPSRLPQLRIARSMPSLPFCSMSVGCGGSEPPRAATRLVTKYKYFPDHQSSLVGMPHGCIGGESGSPVLCDSKVVSVLLRGNERRAWGANLNDIHQLLDEAGLKHCYAPKAPFPWRITMRIAIKVLLGVCAMVFVEFVGRST